jgi:hypothetical protein
MQKENIYGYEWNTGVSAGPLLMVRKKHLELLRVPDCWEERNTEGSRGPGSSCVIAGPHLQKLDK